MTPEQKPVRVQLDLSKRKIDELEQIRTKTGVSTRKDIFENALALLDWAVSQAEEGKKIGAMDQDKAFQELMMPALVSVRKNAYGTQVRKQTKKISD